MTNEQADDKKLQALVEGLELPDSAYESAKRRYDALGAWFERAESSLAASNPHIFVQGSFALGTAIRPLKDGEEYDLDLTCRLRDGVGRASHSQKQAKEMVGMELEAYRRARRIEQALEEKNRCWRLQYQDDLQFHMDVVPGVPVEAVRRTELSGLMEQRGMDRRLAADVAADAVWITDRRSPSYGLINPNWLSSNPEGYARWFRSRMDGSDRALRAAAQVDEIPLFRRKTPLQRAIQLLKRHRDTIFEKAPDSKPASIIITTLAAQAYVPSQSLSGAMNTVLLALDAFRRTNSDIVLNPVNPRENFADRWKLPECRHLLLKENFHNWALQVCADFDYLRRQTDRGAFQERAEARWRVRPSEVALTAALGSATSTAASMAPRRVSIQSAPRPWGR